MDYGIQYLLSLFSRFSRQGLDSNVLRFVAKLKNPENQVDAGRLFVILYYLADDTISVFEPPRRNSGECEITKLIIAM